MNGYGSHSSSITTNGATTVDIDRFRKSTVGNLVPITGVDGRTGEQYTHYGFAPHPLAATPSLSVDTWNALTRASHALGRLEQGSQLVPNPAILRRPTLRREAQSTSALEGTFAPLDEVLAADIIDDANRSSALSEVLNFVDAAERAFDWVSESRPITTGLMCELHGTLVDGTGADTDEAGRIRQIQVAVGSRNGSVYDARFVPMPNGPALDAGFNDLLTWIKPENHIGTSPIVAAAMAHYQFETLHPFNDGNGRLGRLLIVVQLVIDGVLSEGLLSVSPWFEQRREEYQDLLAGVSAEGDWDRWVRFFADGIEASAIDTALRIRALLDAQLRYQDLVRDSGAKGVIRDIVDTLIGTPYVTIRSLANTTGKTYQAVSTAVGKLVELGVLQEISSPGPRVFRATDIVRITTSRQAPGA